ncbi:MAG: hypothetical protein ACRESR_08365, partial [Gammaproteobacteria bacterium]
MGKPEPIDRNTTPPSAEPSAGSRNKIGAESLEAGRASRAGRSTDTKPLQVGLLLDSLRQPAWVYSVVDSLVGSPVAELALVVLNDSPSAVRSSLREKLSPYRAALLFELYTRLDAWRFRSVEDPLAERDIEPLVAGLPVLRVRPRMSQGCDYFTDEDIQRILAYELDVAI